MHIGCKNPASGWKYVRTAACCAATVFESMSLFTTGISSSLGFSISVTFVCRTSRAASCWKAELEEDGSPDRNGGYESQVASPRKLKTPKLTIA